MSGLHSSLSFHLCLPRRPHIEHRTLRQSIPHATPESSRIKKATPVRRANAFIASLAKWESTAFRCRKSFADSETNDRPVNHNGPKNTVDNNFVTTKMELITNRQIPEGSDTFLLGQELDRLRLCTLAYWSKLHAPKVMSPTFIIIVAARASYP